MPGNLILAIDDAESLLYVLWEHMACRVRVEKLNGQPQIGYYLERNSAEPIEINSIVQVKEATVIPGENFLTDRTGQLIRFNVWVGFSPKDHHHTFQRTAGYTENFGYVDASLVAWKPESQLVFEATIQVKSDIQTSQVSRELPFEVLNIGVRMVRPTTGEDRLKLKKFMNGLLEMERMLAPGCSSESESDFEPEEVETKGAIRPVAFEPLHLQYKPQTLLLPLNFELPSRPQNPVFLPILYTTCAVVMAEEVDRYIVYLFDAKKPAAIWKENLEFVQVHLGMSFMANYQEIEEQNGIKNVVLEITHVHQAPSRPLVPLDELIIGIRFRVDLNAECKRFGAFYAKGSESIFKSEEGVFVMMPKEITSSDGRSISSSEIMKQYRGLSKDTWHWTTCILQLRDAPIGMVEVHLNNKNLKVRSYVWVILEIE